MIRRSTTIEQHIGDHPSGLRIVHALEVVTVLTEDEDLAAGDDLHAAKVELASLDVEPRRRATEWIDGHAEEIAGCDPLGRADWIRRAIEETGDPALIARIAALPDDPLPEGAEDRAVERARAAGIFRRR